jgi:hypothetical protein
MKSPALGRRSAVVALAVLAVVVSVGGFLWLPGLFSDGPTSVPSCSWPLRVRGQPEGGQPGLVRCYLRALAGQDSAGLLAVSDTANVPVRITRSAFARALDARSGVATATFQPNQIASDVSWVTVEFADGAREAVEIQLANPASGSSWRLVIGTPETSGRNPAPARPRQGLQHLRGVRSVNQ